MKTEYSRNTRIINVNGIQCTWECTLVAVSPLRYQLEGISDHHDY